MAVKNPLTEQDLTSINEALDRLKDADDIIRMATQGGIDVTAFAVQSREARERLLKMKQAFFPGK